MTGLTLGSAAVATAALLAAGTAACASGPTRATSSSVAGEASKGPSPGVAQPLVSPVNVRSTLQHSRTARPDAMVEWRTAWVLHWDAVPGASGYVVRFATSEGRGGRERHVTATQLQVDAAAGTSPAQRVEADRAAQLTLTASQLLVSVAANGPSGSEGPSSRWYRVGETPTDGTGSSPGREQH